MASTNTIYTNIVEISRMDNFGIELTWTGTPTGTLSVYCSISGKFFYPLTFDPALAQPSGAGGGYLININQEPFKYLLLEYVNSSGTGSIQAYGQQKDLN